MRSDDFRDYRLRLREAIALTRVARESSDPELAGAAAKGATVLAAAALERFINDSLDWAGQQVSASSWNALPQGQRRYMVRQVSTFVSNAAQAMEKRVQPSDEQVAKFRATLKEGVEGLDVPATWSRQPEYGLFANAKTEPDRLDRIVREFDPEDRGLYDALDERGRSRGDYIRALQQLIDARHGVAHALVGSAAPGPTDAQAWIVLSFWLARHVDWYLSRAIGPAKIERAPE